MFRFPDDLDVFLNLRALQRQRLVDLLFLDLPALLQNEALLLAQHTRLLVRDFLLLARLGERFLLLQLQDLEPGFERTLAHRHRRLLGGLVAQITRYFLVVDHGTLAIDVRLLAFLLLGDELDLFFFFRSFLGQRTGDLRNLLLAGFFDQGNFAIAPHLLQRQ